MARSSNNSSVSDTVEPYKADLAEPDTKNSPGNRMKDPVRCAMCSRVLLCPRSRDYEDFMVAKSLKCLSDDDPICQAAVKNRNNVAYIARITTPVSRPERSSHARS